MTKLMMLMLLLSLLMNMITMLIMVVRSDDDIDGENVHYNNCS